MAEFPVYIEIYQFGQLFRSQLFPASVKAIRTPAVGFYEAYHMALKIGFADSIHPT